MSVEIVGLIAFLVGLIALRRGPDFAFKAFIPSTLFGASAAILLPAGTIQPAHLLLGFVAPIVLSMRRYWGAALRSLSFPNEGFWLLLMVAYAVFGAYLLPRFFAGATYVNAIGSTEFGPSVTQVPLGPTSGNITQSIYLVADLVCFLIAGTFAGTPRGFATVVVALLAFCVGNIVCAGLDLVTYWTNTAYLLGFIRNSTYVLHDDTVVIGLKRIVGSFTEASSFAYATLGSLGFTARLWLAGFRPRLNFALSAIGVALLILSTSSTAYAATPVLMVYLYATSLFRAARQPVAPATFLFLVFTPILVGVGIAAIALSPATANSVRDFLAIMLFDKSASQSGLERGQWNQVALANFFDTRGLGGGLGSIRASSFPIALLSNLGIPGALAFTLFMLAVMAARRDASPDPFVSEVRQAARTACVGLLLGATVSGTLVDLGLPFFIFAALACASPAASGPRRPLHPHSLVAHARA